MLSLTSRTGGPLGVRRSHGDARLLVGIGFVAIVTGAVAQRFIAPAEEQAQMSRDELDLKLDALADRLERIETAIGAPRE